MAVKIRLKRMGSKNRPFYRLIAADSRSPRDGRFLENLGYYNPMVEPVEIKIDEDKVYKWLGNGAQPTVSAANLLKAQGILERWELFKSGVKIAELDAKIAERRMKQPKAQPKDKKKLSKKAIAAAKAAEEEAAKVVEEEEKPAEEASVKEAPAEETPAAEAKPAEEVPAEETPAAEAKPAEEAPAEETPAAEAKPAEEAPAKEAEAPAEESGEEKKS